MRRSKRNIATTNIQTVGPSRNKRINLQSYVSLTGTSRALINDNNSVHLLYTCICTMAHHDWYIILPSKVSILYNITFVIGQTWSKIYLILIHLGYLITIKSTVSVSMLLSETLPRIKSDNMELCISTYQLKCEFSKYLWSIN